MGSCVHRLAALILFASLGVACSDSAGPPNLLLISLDTLRPDVLGCYGDPGGASPAIDALARDGVLFESASSVSPWTLPAHGSLLTGLYPSRHGLTHRRSRLRSDVVTLAEWLSQRGYHSAAFVNSHYVSERYGFDRGFAHFRYDREQLARRRPGPGHARVAAWLDAAPPEPWFLFAHYYDAHSDYASLPEWEARFTSPYAGRLDGSTGQLRRFRAGKLAIDAPDRARLLELYTAGVAQLDADIGALLAQIDRLGLRERTLVILTSDHGEEFLEHGGVLHGRTQFSEVLAVPLLMRGPGLPAGRRLATPASLVDVVPTALALLGFAPPPGADGVDLQPALAAPTPALAERVIFGEADHNNSRHDVTRSARRGRFKWVLDRSTDTSQLFDLASDPEEQRDVSAEHPEVTAGLRSALDAFMARRRPGAVLPDLDEAELERLRALGYH